jgi:hypothetical protein
MTHHQDNYKLALQRFATEVPALLRNHSVTASLALDVDRLELGRQLDRKFTLAVVGRMRAGKSTLLNALMSRHMAPVGVNATTATINWFDYGAGELEQAFDVVWLDASRPPERWPLSRSLQFTGDAQLATATRHLRFYAKSEFLRSARIVVRRGTTA